MPDVPTLCEIVRTAGFFALLFVAAWTDVRERRIYNTHLLAGAGVAFGLALILTLLRHDQTLWQAFTGASCGICAGFFLFWLGGIGAGDAKLLGVIGAFSSPMFLLYALTRGALVGCAMGLWHLARHGGWRESLRNFAKSGREDRRKEIATPDNPRTIPYGIALCLGAIWQLFFTFAS